MTHVEKRLAKFRSSRLLEIRDWAKQNGVEFKTELRPLRSSLLDLTRKSETDERGEPLDENNRQRLIWATDIICGLEQSLNWYDYATEFELWRIDSRDDQLEIHCLSPIDKTRNKRQAYAKEPFRISLAPLLKGS